VAKTLSDLQRFMLRRAAEHRIARGKPGVTGDLLYEEVLRKFYRLPRSAFPELRVAEAAISRSVRALERRCLAIKVHHGRHRAGINLTDAGLTKARLIPPSRTLPRANRDSTTAESIRHRFLWRPLRAYLIGSLHPDSGHIEEVMNGIGEAGEIQNVHELIKKAARRRSTAARFRTRYAPARLRWRSSFL
jgi:hypothetical protein